MDVWLGTRISQNPGSNLGPEDFSMDNGSKTSIIGFQNMFYSNILLNKNISSTHYEYVLKTSETLTKSLVTKTKTNS